MGSARVGALAGWTTLACILAFEVIGPSLVAGQPPTGVTDPAALRDYYGHTGLAAFALASYLALPAFAIFVAALRRRLVEAAPMLADVGLIAAAAALAVLLVRTGLELAAIRAVREGIDPMPLHLGWDYTYNSALYAMEATYPVAFGLAVRQVAGFPRWLPVLSVAVGALQLMNLTALVVGLPFAATLPGNLAIAIWFAAASYGLGRSAGAQATRAAVSSTPA